MFLSLCLCLLAVSAFRMDELEQREREILQRIQDYVNNPPRGHEAKQEFKGPWDQVDAIASALMSCGPLAGSAFVVTKGKDIIHMHTQGFADIAKKIPVTPDTLFAIGSTTKAMSAAIMAMMEEEGKIQWTEALGKLYPPIADSFEPKDATLIDLLSMRAGYSPADWALFTNPSITPREVIDLLPHTPFAYQFRSRYSYSNWGYAAGAFLAASIAKTTWEDMISTRLFSPLGMKSTSPYLKTLDESPLAAKPYVSQGKGKNFILLPPGTDTVAQPFGPAGAVVSSISDMTLWLRFLRTGTTQSGVKLISHDRLARTWKPNVIVSRFHFYEPQFPVSYAATSYGIGWGVGSYRSRQICTHAGAIDGFAAHVGFLPGEDIGFAWLTNTDPVVPAEVVMMAAFDVAMGYKPWLNATTACTYPCPWASGCSNKTKEHKPSNYKNAKTDSNQHKTETVPLPLNAFSPYIGDYHSTFGNCTISATQITFPLMRCLPSEHKMNDLWIVTCLLGPADYPLSAPLQFVRNFKGEVVGMSISGESLGSSSVPNFNWKKKEYVPQVPFRPEHKPGIGPEL